MKKIITFLTIVFCLNANAQYTNLLSFQGIVSGYNPVGSLTSDGTYLYGMTNHGGSWGNGTIFKIKPDGTGYDTLLNFTGTNGYNTYACSLMFDGTFIYGMTYGGGAHSDGVIFKINPSGTGYVKLLDFSYYAPILNGGNPTGSLISDGTFLYGTTFGGGTNSRGTIFKINLNGTGYDTLHNFASPNGQNPYGSLVSDGTFFYGVTQGGGVYNAGTIYKIKPDGSSYSKLLDFNDTNGYKPSGSLFSDGTYLYGMTSRGGIKDSGVIFKIKSDGTGFTKLLDFAGVLNGSNPYSSLISDGTFLYGMTANGGTNNWGVLFQIKPDGTGYSKLLDFNNANGLAPFGSLYYDGSCLYGTTINGGTYGDGTVFKYCLVTGIEQLSKDKEQIIVYPNPTSDQFFIDANTSDKLNVDIYDVNGRHVYSASVMDKSNISVATLDNGAYTLTIKTADRVLNKKLVILR